MAGKITLSIEHIDPKHPDSRAMAQTIGLLAQLADLPSGNLKLAIACEEEDMDAYVDDLRAALSRRPVGIRIKIQKQSEDEIERETLPTTVPMDRMWDDGPPLESVTLSHNGRSVTLDANTRRNAEAILRRSGGAE